MNVSEDSSEKTRGRPPLIPPKIRRELEAIYSESDQRSDRWMRDQWHAMDARSMLVLSYVGDELEARKERFAWLLGRKSLLTELGRFIPPEHVGRDLPDHEFLDLIDLVESIADRLCHEKPNTRKAIAWLRQCRLKKGAAAGDPDQLTAILIRSMNDYLARYPGTTWEQVQAAAWEAFRAVVHTAQAEHDEGAQP